MRFCNCLKSRALLIPIISIPLILIAFLAFTADAEESSTLPDPAKFNKLNQQKKNEILSSIAEQSYQKLLKVPENGLRKSKKDIEEITKSRLWLEQTNNTIAMHLALSLKRGIDSCVINELFRKENKLHGETVVPEFNEKTLDNELIFNILESNKLDRNKYYKYAVSLDTEIGKEFRSSDHQVEKFKNWQNFVFKEISFTVPWIENDGTKLINIKRKIKDVDLFRALFLLNKKNWSQKNLNDFMFPEMFKSFDVEMNVWLLCEIYKENGRLFGNEIKNKRKNSRVFINRFKKKLNNSGRERFRLDKKFERNGTKIKITYKAPDLVCRKIFNWLQVRTDFEADQKTSYKIDLYRVFFPYMPDLKLMPDIYKVKFKYNKLKPGMFLIPENNSDLS